MKRKHNMTLELILATMLAFGCNDDFVIPSPVENPDTAGDDSGIPVVEPGPGKLVADGNDTETYLLITSCGYNYETPDNSGLHSAAPFRHITQSYDEFLRRPVFNFILHIENDDDRGKEEIIDRQRNEIKTDAKSPADMVAAEGETLRMSWKFRLPEGMLTTTKFSHIHQLKGIDNKEGTADVSTPLVTYTVRSLTGGKQQFQVIFNGPADEGPKNEYLAKADLGGFLGAWVEVTETVTFSKDGRYSLSIRRLGDGRELVNISREGLNLWREGSAGMRPKWGLYRYFGENRSLQSQLRDETLKFADFRIEKL